MKTAIAMPWHVPVYSGYMVIFQTTLKKGLEVTVSSICKTISCLNLERFFTVEIGSNSADRKRHKWTPKNI